MNRSDGRRMGRAASRRRSSGTGSRGQLLASGSLRLDDDVRLLGDALAAA
jgi:hypothetical protein